MRERKKIEKESKTSAWMLKQAILEVLLDIRDLLKASAK